MGYVSQNILGMIGISIYVLADTFFISIAEGAGGITALNLVLPLYSLIYGIGAMLGIGSAIRFNILRARHEKSADDYFSGAIIYALLFGICFMILGAFFPDKIVELFGGDEEIIAIGTPYTRIFMLFAPFFMWNHVCNAFVRNDGNPSLAMKATLFSSLFNIVMDYILMFPLGLGMAGAALATAISPIVAVFNSEQNKMMAFYAFTGVKIYFVGFLFAGCNIVGAGYLSATEKASLSFGISMMRGVVAIIICAVVLAYFLGMTGVWLAFPVAEGLTFVLMWIALKYKKK